MSDESVLQKVNSVDKSDGNTSFLRAARAGNLDKVLEHLKNNIDINTCNANGLNALHLASKDGHVHVVSELLKRGAIVDSATKKGNTALHIASLAGQEEVVKLLLQHNASVNVQSQNGFTPLYMAAQENHDSVVKLLLANGANQSLATEDGFTPLAVAMQQGHDKVVAVLLESDTRGKVRLPALHIAAKKDDVKAATLLLENNHNPDVTSKSGFTPLHIASHYGNEAIANLLIQNGADVNYAAKHNITPLHVAAKWGKTNMVSLLLEKGANIESKTRDGLTPLHCAARSGHEQVVDMLLERGAPISAKTKNGLAPLHMAAQGEHVDAARILLYHRAPVDEVTVDYLTALHVAAHCGHVRVAKLLLDRNADANARALNGFTPLHIACKKNRIKVVELLLRHGASISATTESGLTPLHVASFMGCMNIVIYLLQHDASPDVPTVRGETPLHLAARANQTDIIRILLRNGAQVDARAREQQTPLHIASRLGNVDIVMLLLQHGAQVDATTKDMYTALHIAAKEGQDEVAAVLIENGASLDATTKKGFTPLHLTAKYGHIKVAQLLLQKDAAVDAQGKNGVTPLHVASHYDHQDVALLLLEKGASPHATAKNGHTPLHISARKNQMDIATTLLEYGAQADAESKAGFTPLHLSAQEGHTDMSALLLEHKAGCDHQARNGLTPLHLCAQEDKVNVAQVLVNNGANIEVTTKAGYTPLHVASHFGQANMVRFLLQNGANVDAATGIGYTPLHQAAQQGHCHIVNLLLEHKANANAQTANGQTPLHIAKKLGYISVLDSLKSITNESLSPTQTQDEKYRVVAPEAMHETFMSDSEEEGGEDTVLSDQPYRYLTVDEMKSLGDDSLPIDVTRDERIDSNRMVQSTDSTGHQPPIIEGVISPQHAQVHMASKTVPDGNYIADNILLDRHPQHVGRKLQWKNFLVSFLVDARGGAMRGCRHSGVRIIVPTRSASQPTRITCRYVKPQRTMHPPQLMEGEALASRVLELGPVSTKFLGPVIMEVPHFASLRGKEREIVILRSDNGETWREHTIDNSEEIIHDVLNECFEPEDINQLDELGGGRICRFVTYDFPQYFAVVSRIRQEVHAIGPEGGMVSSTVVPQVQAVFPQGALTKKIKVGLQAQPIDPDLTAKLLGRGVAVSPIVTVEPRRRKFHKAITLSMPAPKAHSQGMINQYSGNAPTLRLLCSITGGPSRAQWEDVTGSTPLTFVNDCVSFTTTVSARFWLMDCRNISEATKMATELYREAIHVPFMAKFVVFAKRVDPNEARLRVFCMTDDKEDKTLEQQEHFTEVAKSRDVEVLEGKSQYIEMAGNLVPITKSGEQLQLTFRAFRENRLPFSVRVKDQHADTVGRTLFMREPKVAKGEPPQQPICILNIVLPENIIPDQLSILSDSREMLSRMDITTLKNPEDYYLGDMRIVDISNLLGEDWVRLAPEIGITQDEIDSIEEQHPTSTAQQAQSMIKLFKQKKTNDRNVLENGLRVIGRNDIIKKCIKITSYIETSKHEPLVERRHKGLDNAYESDLMKDSESIEDLVVLEDRRLQQMRERDEAKYSGEEKAIEDSESDDENIKRSVAERRQKIEKRLSIERQIPASTQKKEIVQEITEIKRKSLIEDKKAIHEEEIMLQMPTDNIIKSAVVPDQILKLKTNKIETPDVSKTEFDKELQDKFKKTVKIQDDDDEILEETSKIVFDSTVTEKSTKHEITTAQEPDDIIESTHVTVSYAPSDETHQKTTRIKIDDRQDVVHAVTETVEDILDKSQQFVSDNKTTRETISLETKREITKVRIETKDPDLEMKLSKQKEKIESVVEKVFVQPRIEFTEDVEEIKEEVKSKVDSAVDEYVPKSYHEKPRESLTEEEFCKSVEASITKKMSEGLIQISDDVLASLSKEIPESQTPPPTPIETNVQKYEKYESPGSIPEEITEVTKDDYEGQSSPSEHSKEPRGDTASTEQDIPKPTPRISKIVPSDILEVQEKASKSQIDGHLEESKIIISKKDEKEEGIIEDVDFKQSKKFWESLESSVQSDTGSVAPVPKPRSQIKPVESVKGEESIYSIRSSSHDSKISSEQHVEYSETSSVHTSLIDDKDHKDDDSEISERIEDETFPDLDKIHKKSFETDEDDDIIKLSSESKDDVEDDDAQASEKQASFYIGESSTNIITKSITDKRHEYAFDNKGYDDTFEDERAMDSLEPEDDTSVQQDETAPQIAPHQLKQDDSLEDVPDQKIMEKSGEDTLPKVRTFVDIPTLTLKEKSVEVQQEESFKDQESFEALPHLLKKEKSYEASTHIATEEIPQHVTKEAIIEDIAHVATIKKSEECIPQQIDDYPPSLQKQKPLEDPIQYKTDYIPLEIEKSSTKIFRQDSETRNDILECETFLEKEKIHATTSDPSNYYRKIKTSEIGDTKLEDHEARSLESIPTIKDSSSDLQDIRLEEVAAQFSEIDFRSSKTHERIEEDIIFSDTSIKSEDTTTTKIDKREEISESSDSGFLTKTITTITTTTTVSSSKTDEEPEKKDEESTKHKTEIIFDEKQKLQEAKLESMKKEFFEKEEVPMSTMKTTEIKDIKFEDSSHKQVVTEHVYFEEQIAPMLQEAVHEDIKMYTAEVLESQITGIEETKIKERSQVTTKQLYSSEIVESKIYEELTEHKEAVSVIAQEACEREYKLDDDKISSVTVETDISKIIRQDIDENVIIETHSKKEEKLIEKAHLETHKIHTDADDSKFEAKEKIVKKSEETFKSSEHKVKFEPKLELNLDKSELELSEKSFAKSSFKHEDVSEPKPVLSPVKGFKGFTTFQDSKETYKKSLLIDPSQVDESMVEQTLEEVKESLDAVQEELIEVVKDGKLIKQSPSEFEFKILPSMKYMSDPIQEFHEESTSGFSSIPEKGKESSSKSESPEKRPEQSSSSSEQVKDSSKSETFSETGDTSKTEDFQSLSSADESTGKLKVVHRIRKEATDSLNRWSVPDLDHSSSGDSHFESFERSDSRPLSSDVEQLLTCGNSSEYQTAMDASLLPESTEYVSAASTFSSGKTMSSHESMKSLDSESSANLGSIEISEISETLVPSIAEGDDDDELDADDSDIKLSSLEDKFCGVLMEEYHKEDESIPSQMKRSQEMTFQPEPSEQASLIRESPDMPEEREGFQIIQKFSSSIEDSRLEDTRFPSSLEDGSVLSMSLSSASCVETVVENAEDLASSLGASSLAGADIHQLIRDDYTGTSFDEPAKTEKIDSMIMTSSVGKDLDQNYANTQITTTVITTTTTATESAETEPKRKGHKRNESAAFGATDFLKEIEAAKAKGTESSVEEEDAEEPKEAMEVYKEDKKESESESDYDQYESEYSRAYKVPTNQKKSKEKRVETFEKDQEPEKRPFTPSESVSEIIAEDAAEEIESIKVAEALERPPSQNMLDYSNIPDITITEDLRKYSEDDEELDEFKDKVLYKVKTQEELHKADDAPLHYAKEQEFSIAEDQYQELIERQYESTIADITTKYARDEDDDDDKADSPDSFEMLEQPDISDEFVIIEEVAKEANEFDTEGKSISIKNVKYVQKHDEEVEKILVKSAPAAPNEGSAMYMRDDLNFDFEESPPTGQDAESAETSDSSAVNKRWVEMQLSDNASHLRYPYELERGVLEDIKEEDTEFEVGSSRISSFKDSFSSTPEYDVLAGRKYFTREHDDVSMSSLQEFESLEQAISLENRRTHQGSQDSLSNGSFTRRYMVRQGQGDDVSLSSLKEFEGLENACIEAHLIEIKAKEEAAQLLSRSDESNKSSNGEEKGGSVTVTTVTSVKTSTTQSTSSSERTLPKTQQEIEALIRAKLEECEEEASNLMEVSTDSLESGLKKSKSTNGTEADKKSSEHGSCDSLEINKSGDIMTSSIDSFEISKDATARSSRSDVDSLEQQILQDVRRDSIDSIELEQALHVTKTEKELFSDSGKEQKTMITTTTITQGPAQIVQSKTVTTTTTATISGGGSSSTTETTTQEQEMTKDISSDSLNINQTDQELLLTSTESLDRTSSTATNATYQNENDSLMSGSMTSCGSNTMIDTLDSTFADTYQGASSTQFLFEETRSQVQQTRTQIKDGETKRYEYFEIFDKDISDKLDTSQPSKSGEDTGPEPKQPDDEKK